MAAGSWWTSIPPRAGPRSACSGRTGGDTTARAVIVATQGKPVRSRHGPATVSGEPRPYPRNGSHWETSREGRAAATIHESGDLIATGGAPPFERKGAVVRQTLGAVLAAMLAVAAPGAAQETKPGTTPDTTQET